MNGRHNLCHHGQGLAVSGRGGGFGKPPHRGLVDVRDDQCEAGVRGLAIGLRATQARYQVARSYGLGQLIRQPRVPPANCGLRDHDVDVQEGQRLGQRGDGKLLQNVEG